ncbi:MAG: aldo/keto reductase [Kordiimonadaceae bacterium]|jgi:aryl-alcohol dehydrogenase-like predicted oxidoreductase|nr:aldo/keto reductase [Kordiimonadaceae bacterium]MBT6035398.1 aldo/keto reductase [Kordiimonadaceae bacterium]MBT6330063.1 aldo/keto reductase [Kordiimonadaceae bacterium]MBT7581478.1 aldo/keto reductase [Kordiimonadaceae bacterium]
MIYNRLGQTGIKVSQLCLGTMTFDDGADEAEAAKIYAAARDKGVNFFDCANVYAGGTSEEILGRLIKSHREEVVISSKAYFPVDSYAGGGHETWGRGLNRTHLRHAVDASLKRLGTDYIDIYYMHHFDEGCTLEESLSTFNDFVREGKINYIGLSNFAAWQYMKAVGVTKYNNYAPIACIQPMYSLLKRQCESEILPMSYSEGLGVFSYSPLGGGVLTGKYLKQDKNNEEGRLNKMAMYKKRYQDEKHMRIAENFTDYARSRDINPISLAISWVEANKAITAPIIGGRSVEQLRPSLDSIDIVMDEEMYNDLSLMADGPETATDRSEERSD